MTSHLQGEIRPNSDLSPATSAVPFDYSSSAVQQLPDLLEVHRLAEYIHTRLINLSDALPLAISGWVLLETNGHLAEARAALLCCVAVIAKGVADYYADQEDSHG